MALPASQEIVLLLLHELDAPEGVAWDRLRRAAAEKGIDEHELASVMDALVERGFATPRAKES